MLLELLNTISLNTFVDQFIDYTLLTIAFFSFFTIINNLWAVNKENKIKIKCITQ